MLPLRRHSKVVPLLSAALLSPAVAAAQAAPGPLAGIDDFAARVLERWEAPGLALAVVKDGEVILERGWGSRLAGTDDPVDENTVFAIASTTKAFTAATLGMLVDQGSLSWDDPVAEHLPGFQLRDPWATREITVRDLLSHRSGLPRGDHLWYLSPFEREEVLDRVRHLEPATSFRSSYGYQNIMFISAGEIVEARSGVSWDAFLRSRILDPLGMSRTSTSTSELSGSDNVASPHVRLDGAVVPVPWPDFDNLGGAGSINSSVHDMASWIRLQLAGGTLDERTFWSDSVAREMWEPNTVVPLGPETRRTQPETHLQSYGMGWILQDYRGRLVVRHGGSLDGMRAHVALVPEEGLGIVALTNLNESRLPLAVVWEVVDRFLEPRATPRDWNEILLAEAERERSETDARRARADSVRVPGTRPSRTPEAHAGTYSSVMSGEVEITLEDGALRLTYGPNFTGTLEHWHYDTWQVAWRNRSQGTGRVTFRLDASGEVAEVSLSGVDTFRRVRAGN